MYYTGGISDARVWNVALRNWEVRFFGCAWFPSWLIRPWSRAV